MGVEAASKNAESSPQDQKVTDNGESSPIKFSVVSNSKRRTRKNLLRFLKTAKVEKQTESKTTDKDGTETKASSALSFPTAKEPSKAHVNLSSVMLHISTMICKHLVYWGGIYKDHYITVNQLHNVLQDILAKHGTIKTPDLSTSVITPKNTPLLIIDARRPDEYAVSHIPGAVNIHSILSRRLSRCLRNVDFDTPIVVYCAVGLRSGWTATRLRAMGFKNVKTLEGAYYRWAGDGKPIVGPKDEPVKEVLPQHFLAAIVLDRQIRAKVEKTKGNNKKIKQELILEAPKTECQSAPLQHDHLVIHEIAPNDSITW